MNPLQPSSLLDESKLQEKLTEFMKSRMKCNGCDMDTRIGYPIPFKLDLHYANFTKWYGTLDSKYKMILNNAGDPHLQDVLSNSHDLENYVIKYFASKLGFIDTEEIAESKKEGKMYWGFISASGTDGNNHGIYYGRKFLAQKQPVSMEKIIQPVVYLSKEAHYSVKRMADLQNLACVEINTDSDTGALNVLELESKIDRTKPIIIMATIGTTMRGAIDDVAAINQMLRTKELPLGYYIHIDAALFGGYLMYCKPEAVSVSKLGYHSISISGHKFFGCDDPCGIFVTSRDVKDCVTSDTIPYLNSSVPTLTCSRSGLAALKLYYKLNASDISLWEKEANQCLDNAKLLLDLLNTNKFKAWRTSGLSNTIIIEKPSDKIVYKYQLASSDYEPYGGKISHIVVMQHVDKKLIKRFINDLIDSRQALSK